MAHVVAAIVTVANAHALVAYGLAFLLAAFESFPVFGALVPGTATIVALGALVPSGALGFWPLVVATTAGAIAGDGFSYWLGHHYKGRAATVWPLRRHPDLIGHGEAFFERHGGKAIVIARFTPGVRAVVPLVAGVAGMPAARFYGMNILSAVLWAPVHVAMGVAIGASLTILGAVAGRLAALVFAVFLLIVVIVWLTPRATRWLGRLATRLRDPVRAWATRQNTWLRRQVLSLLDPLGPEVRGLAVLGVVLIGSVWVLFGVLQDLVAGDPLVRADQAVFHLFQSLRVEWADYVAVAATELGDLGVTVAVAIIALLWLAWRGAWRAAAYELAAMAGAFVFAVILDLIHRTGPGPIPTGGVFLARGGQIAVAVALYAFLAVLIVRETRARLSVGTVTVVVLLMAVLGLGRLYVGADWLSTIVAGTAFAVAWVALLSIAYLSRHPRPVRPIGLLAVTSFTLIIAGGATIGVMQQTDLRRYAVAPETRTMTLAEWEQGAWTTLPSRRLDLLGEYEEPFTLQWVGRLGDLEADLSAHGWVQPIPWTLRSTLEWLSPQASPGALPVLPRLDSGRQEGLVMIKTGDAVPKGERVVVRLWRSDLVLSSGAVTAPLWIGAVAAERVAPVGALMTVAVEQPGTAVPLRVLHEAIPFAQPVRRADAGSDSNWNGSVLLGGRP